MKSWCVAATMSIYVLASFTGAIPASAQDAKPPNLIFIMADDLGYGDLACYGHPRNRTPHIDRMAAEGLKFTDFHSNGPMCSPTRAALMTGLYQNRFGRPFETALSVKSPEIGLPTGVDTIPQVLKRAGYATGMYGKWHLGYQAPHLPSHFAFDDFRGLLTGDGDHISHVSRSGTDDWYHNDEIKKEEGYTTELITKHSINFMRENKDKPFFLYVSHLAIHFPWQAPGEDAHRVVGKDYWSLEKLGPHPEGAVTPVVQAMVEAVDDSVGEIIAAVRELGIAENTFVIFTSDNGGYLNYADKFDGEISSNAPYRGQKTQVWEGGHRVPAIAWWPGRILPGTTSRETAMTMDILPTYAELAGQPKPKGIDGATLTSVLFNGNPLPARSVFWRAREEWAVRQGPWKLVGSGGQTQLFNLEEDAGETVDRASDEPARAESLRAAYNTWENDVDG